MRILFVSSPHPEANWLSRALQECGHSLLYLNALASAADMAASEQFDAAVLMIHAQTQHAELQAALPQVCAALRGAIAIAVVPNATAQERESILHAGADACFARPFSFVEMHDRLQVLHHTMQIHAARSASPARAAVQLDAVTRELVNGERRLPLTKREYLLVECLMRDPDLPVAHDRLLRYTWSGKDVTDPGSVSPLVWRLRCKLKKHLPSVCISTVQHYGYQLSLSQP